MSSIGFDITAMAAEVELEDEGAWVEIEDLSGTPLTFPDAEGNEQPVAIKIAGRNSKRYRRLEEQQNRRRLDRKKVNTDTFKERLKDLAIACTLDWRGIGDKGAQLECTTHNVRMLYELHPWIMDQVVTAQDDHELFSKSSSTPLSNT